MSWDSLQQHPGHWAAVTEHQKGFVGVRWKPRVFSSDQVTDFVLRWQARSNINGEVQPDWSVECDGRVDQ